MKDVLKSLFSSKKFLALLAGILVFLASKAGWGLSESDVMPVLLLVGTYLGAQGMADFGKSRSLIEAAALREVRAQEAKKPMPRGKK